MQQAIDEPVKQERTVLWRRLAWFAPLFFLIKGIAWLVVPALLLWMGVD